MKVLALLVLPLVALTFSNLSYASDKEEKEEKVEVKKHKDGGTEYKMKVKKKGKDYVGTVEKREYILRGESAKKLKSGEYTIYGTVSDDDSTIETHRITKEIK